MATDATSPRAVLAATGSAAARPATGRGLWRDAWVRLRITEDVDLAVRAEIAAGQMPVFREVADLLRAILLNPDALLPVNDE